MTKDIDIATFTKNRTSDIKVRLIEEYGHTYIDIRQWTVARDDCFPTAKGIKLDTANFEGLEDAVEAIHIILRAVEITDTSYN